MNNKTSIKLILASSSVYRKELLSRLYIPFTIISPDIDENPLQKETPEETALRLSTSKAKHISESNPGFTIIGADQVCSCDGILIGKSGEFNNAKKQLQFMSDKRVFFISAISITNGNKTLSSSVTTECKFKHLSDDKIEHYLQKEKPYDTAGSVKMEKLGITLVEYVKSDDPTAILGLPLIKLTEFLKEFSIISM
ncbi:septum formation protein [Candidatus Kinetoplastibacterium blastocrithidii TCC012E]|uniref:7-methyl-GTP pyrophosphatase n=1 Tax=Candidatus Kinetoplastidibacterium blastocrithidiae TCC012E TaxID=1208922 RepID=M1MDU3_9PROT|nr:Maf family nucleotide pyrophosphatase [Candidatus Kinetoplastibacterium blastocrithidii]AFZ83770.1 septum formation protein [Candidatus Kinetoplastibacterium blastocrithidii (ex Strigomonas culicis)]AGF49895.1 septum formation protein [Candidatus Kinetoplastibacterium blastocrithidii TCC012E]